MRVRPAHPAAIIRDPHTARPLPPEGAEVADSIFWRRRLQDGDVVLVADGDELLACAAAPVAPLTTRG